ncbi:MAG TPA: acetate uptake transporter [Actinospica sp.]|jgi:succinate-acetate transporter protein|nr:acetate uptake transporter [Actinospica sp.]
MSTESTPTTAIADPAPLGLFGFGFTTLMLSLANANVLKLSDGGALIFALAVFYGGGAQLIAGLWDFRRGNLLGATAFFSYGAFWLIIWYALKEEGGVPASNNGLAWFFLGWAILTAIFTVASLKTTHALTLTLLFLTLTFLFLAFGAWQHGTAPTSLTKIGGWLGVVTGLLAWYTAAANVINTGHKRELLPLNLKR